MQEDETVPETDKKDRDAIWAKYRKNVVPETEDEGSIRFQMSDRHPDFDRMWEKHRKLVYHQASSMARIFNSGDHIGCYRYGYSDFLGTMVLRFNYCLHHYTEDKGAFSTYFYARIAGFCVQFCLRYESEYWATRWFSTNKSYEVGIEAQNNREFYESEYFLYRVPDDFDHDWTVDIINLFETPAHLWEYLARGVPERSINIALWYYRDGETMRAIADKLGISLERVRQILEATRRSFRGRIQRLEAFRKLFSDQPEMLEQ